MSIPVIQVGTGNQTKVIEPVLAVALNPFGNPVSLKATADGHILLSDGNTIFGETSYWPLTSDANDRTGLYNLYLENGPLTYNNGAMFANGEILYSTDLQLPAQFTMTLRFTPQTDGVTEVLWAQYTDTAASWAQVWRADSDIFFSTSHEGENGLNLIISTIPNVVTVDTEIFIAAVAGDNGAQRLYVNSSTISDAIPLNSTPILQPSIAFTIGANGESAYPLYGKIRDVRFFGRVLSASEINTLRLTGIPNEDVTAVGISGAGYNSVNGTYVDLNETLDFKPVFEFGSSYLRARTSGATWTWEIHSEGMLRYHSSQATWPWLATTWYIDNATGPTPIVTPQ